MDLSNFREMDPAMLCSLVNMKLRNDYDDLQDLAKSLDIDAEALRERLREQGFEFDAEIGQRPLFLRSARPGRADGRAESPARRRRPRRARSRCRSSSDRDRTAA